MYMFFRFQTPRPLFKNKMDTRKSLLLGHFSALICVSVFLWGGGGFKHIFFYIIFLFLISILFGKEIFRHFNFFFLFCGKKYSCLFLKKPTTISWIGSKLSSGKEHVCHNNPLDLQIQAAGRPWRTQRYC